MTNREDQVSHSDIIGGFQINSDVCAGCSKPLLIENAWMTDGCPCNTPLGVNSMNEKRWRLLMELQQKQAREVEALRKFKAYVHQRLDEAGIPEDPDSPHKAEGCRIGGRLDIALGDLRCPKPGETQEIIHHVRESAFLALAAQRDLLIAARADLYAIRQELQSATLRLAMLQPLERIGDAIEAMTEVTRKD